MAQRYITANAGL